MSMLDSDQPMPVVMRSRCINCSLLIPRNNLQHSLQQASTTMIILLRSWITPTELSLESVLCTECMVTLQDRASTFIDGNALPLPAFGHRSLCFSCGKSTLRTLRTHAVRSDCQERKIILRKVPLHLASRLERVCNACWSAAYREVRRQNQHDTDCPIVSEVGTSGKFNIPVPPPLPQHTSQHFRQPSPARAKITSAVYSHAANTVSHCIFVDCFESERLLIPAAIKELLLLNHKFFRPPGAQICNYQSWPLEYAPS